MLALTLGRRVPLDGAELAAWQEVRVLSVSHLLSTLGMHMQKPHSNCACAGAACAAASR